MRLREGHQSSPHRTTKAAFCPPNPKFSNTPTGPGNGRVATAKSNSPEQGARRFRMGGNRPDRHAASIKASSIPPQAAEPCPIHDLRAVTAGRASACAKTLSSNTASLRSLRGVPVPCAETQSTAWGSRPASASAPRTACSAKRADSSGAVSAPPSREAPNPRSSANTAAPRDAALLPSEAGTAAYAGDDDPIHIPAKAAPRGCTPQCHQGRAAGRHPGWTSQGRAPLRAPGKGRDIHGG